MDIVVIGAGLSGLTAAATLCAAGAKVQVLEASSHIGGRIRALRDPVNQRALADLGPTWVWPKYQPIAARWLAELGLSTFEQFNEGDAVILGYRSTPVRQRLPAQDGIARIIGGPTAVVDALASRIGHNNIRTSAPVTGIAEVGESQVAIQLNSGEIVTTQKVIIALPVRVAHRNLMLPWAPPNLIDAMRGTPTWMATQAKAVALYERPFWRDAGLSGRIASRTGPLLEAHDHSSFDTKHGAIFGFVGWDPARRSKDPHGLRQAVLNQLCESFGEAALPPIELVIQDWATDCHIVTDLDFSHPATHPDVGPAVLRQAHLDGRVRFAVSEVSDVSPGLIEGGFAVGENAGLDIIKTSQ